MKALVNNFLNIRTLKPELRGNNNPHFLKPGDIIEIDEPVVGEELSGNKIWFKLTDGVFVWSGGTDADWSSFNNKNSELFNLHKIAGLWKFGMGDEVKVAVIDSFIDQSIPALKFSKINVLSHLNANVN